MWIARHSRPSLPKPSAAAHAAGGFTLVEVLVVVVIVGIAGAVIVPQMLRAGTMNVQAAARMVTADLLYAQNDAIAQQAARRVIFDVPGNRYRVADSGGTALSVTWKGAGAANYVTSFATDGRFAGVSLLAASFGSDSFIEYDDLGSPSSGGSIDLVASGLRYRVTVTPMTGRVSVAPVSP